MNRNIIIIISVVLVLSGLWLFLSKDDVTQVSKHKKVNGAAIASEKSEGSKDISQLYAQAKDLKAKGQYLDSRKILQEILQKHSSFEQIGSVQNDLESINLNIIFSNTHLPEKSVIHEVVSGDTLGKLAKKYGTTIELIKKKNNLKSDIIRIGQRLTIWNAPFSIHVDKSQNILMLRTGNEVLKVYRVSTGKDNNTPVGSFVIKSKLVDPVWFNKGVVVPPDSPANVLGTRWLGFDIPGYGIHGTVEPETIGQQVTAGCVRMRNTEVEELYSVIPLGTKVTVVD